MTIFIRRPLTLWDASRHGDQPYAATLIFREADPFAVALVIPDHDADGVHEVVFSRALLIDGLEAPCGEPGFAQIEPHAVSDYITLTLPIAGGQRELYAERSALEAFVDESFVLVLLGGEREPAAAELDRWLAEVTP
jgi:hypothetical protein